MSLAALLSLLLLPAGATEPPALPDMAPSRNAPGWQRQGNSLLLYDEDGALVQEHGLQSTEESAGSKLVTHDITAGASANGRAAWLLDRRVGWNYAKTKVLDARRRLTVFGAGGAELWSDNEADAPEQGDPVSLSDDGKVALYARRDGTAGGWSVVARDWAGNTLMVVGPYPRLMSLALTPNGRFVMARWAIPDKSATHTFLDLKRRQRKDVASSELTLGLARVEDDGVVRSGRRVVFELAASTETAK
ncbi:MAG: hypothetical protein SF051_01445 [Elusimicrobiota bacterium]|nr:hypothetical protein [Elusimicrobiota bacterium]